MIGHVSSPGVASCWPSAIVWPTVTRSRRPDAFERATSSVACGSTPTTRVRRRQRRDDRRAAADQPAAADRHDEQVELAGVLEQLEGDGAGAGHDERLVVGVDDAQPALGGELRLQRGAVVGVAVEADDLGAVALRRGALGGGRVVRHEDRRVRAAEAGGERQRLGVVARRGGADAAQRRLGLGERRDRVVGAAELERADALQALGLERDPRVEALVERARAHDRRAVRDAGQPRGGAPDVLDRAARSGTGGACAALSARGAGSCSPSPAAVRRRRLT